MPSLRKRVSSYFRQLSFYNEPRERKHNINENSFVTKYLEGHVSIKEGPPILYGKNPTDLPNYDLSVYNTGPDTIVGCYSGPNGGLTTVKRLEKHLSIPDTDIDFIDTQDEPEAPANPPVLQKSPQAQNRQTVDNTTMVIKVAGQEYLVTNRKKHENKSHSLGSLTDFDVEIEKTKICTEISSNNNNNEDVKCKNQELANTQSDNQKNSISNENQKISQNVLATNQNKNIGAYNKKGNVQKGAQGKRGDSSQRKTKSPDTAESSKVNYGLAKSKSEGNPFQHKKKGKIIRISSRPTAHVDNVSTSSDVPQPSIDPNLPEEWNRQSDHIYGISDSLYDKNQVTKNKNGDPIADCFGIIARNDSAVLAVADGVNWGEKASVAAKSAIHGCLHYLDKTIFNDTKPFDELTTKSDLAAQKASPIFSQHRVTNTREVFVCLLRAFNCAHDLILENEGMLTTLTVAVVLPLKSKNVKSAKSKEKGDSLNRQDNRPRRTQPERQSGRNIRTSFRESSIDENADSYVCCVCNVGDTLAYVYSHKYGVRELTKGSHDVNCNRDMRDALGALGPVDGINPELSNLTLSVTVVQKGDIILVASDGLTDNFDPNVCKFTVNSKDSRPKRPSTSKEGHHNKENVNVEAEKPQVEAPTKPEDANEAPNDKNAKMPIKPPRKNKDNMSRSSRERSVDSIQLSSDNQGVEKGESSSKGDTSSHLVQKNLNAEEKASLMVEPSSSSKLEIGANEKLEHEGFDGCTLPNSHPIMAKFDDPQPEAWDKPVKDPHISEKEPNTSTTKQESTHETTNKNPIPIKSTKRSSDSSEPIRKKSTASNDYDNPLVAQFMRENSLDEKANLEKSKKSLEQKPIKTLTSKKPSSSHPTIPVDPKTLPNQPKVHVHKTASRNIPLNKGLEHKPGSQVQTSSSKSNVTGFLRSKTSLDMRTSAKTVLRNEDGIPFVTPLQRYEISLLLMEDILKHGISGHDSQCTTAKKVCENLVNFTFSISSAKRHTLEDTDLYFDNVNGVLVEVSQQEKKARRRKGLERVQNLPGKLDHVSVVAYNVGNFAYTY